MKFFMYTMGDENDPRLSAPPSRERRLSDGSFTVTDGPFAEAKELIGGWALVEVASLNEAKDWAKRFLRIVGGGDSRIRPVYGP